MAAPGREVLFEFIRQGNFVRVAAVDALSGVEVVVVAPAGAAQADLEALALRKLQRALGESCALSPQPAAPARTADEHQAGPKKGWVA